MAFLKADYPRDVVDDPGRIGNYERNVDAADSKNLLRILFGHVAFEDSHNEASACDQSNINKRRHWYAEALISLQEVRNSGVIVLVIVWTAKVWFVA